MTTYTIKFINLKIVLLWHTLRKIILEFYKRNRINFTTKQKSAFTNENHAYEEGLYNILFVVAIVINAYIFQRKLYRSSLQINLLFSFMFTRHRLIFRFLFNCWCLFGLVVNIFATRVVKKEARLKIIDIVIHKYWIYKILSTIKHPQNGTIQEKVFIYYY